jgi:hypothetical protein
MKRTIVLLALALVLGLAQVVTLSAADKPLDKPSLKIGVYDSRVVALAYYRSASQMARFKGLHEEYSKAKADKNEKRMQELEKEGPWSQIRMHQQVFSTAGILNITSQFPDAIKTIAQTAGVAVIVSKWEMPYLDPALPAVDVTLAMAKLFNPDEQTMKIMEGMKNQAPVPFDQLSLDPNM